MKLFPLALIGLLTLGAPAVLAATSSTAVLLAPNAMHWVVGTGPNKGTSAAVFVGDPAKTGTAIMRVKMVAGYVNQPHYHSHPEYITVIAGALLFGTGDTIDKSKARLLPTGSFIMVPAGVHHWSIAQGETTEQIGGDGPLNNVPVKKTM